MARSRKSRSASRARGIGPQRTGRSGVAPGYLHGYSRKEQDRLYRQARFLERQVFDRVDFSKAERILEVGSGVGAQTEILLERFPRLRVRCIDASEAQVRRARAHLASAIREGRVELSVGDALHLPDEDNAFDGAFVCWFLEHVQKPVEILREIRRVLRPSATIYCNEVLNATFFVHPYSPATLQYWFAFNDYQWSLKGDPFVGAKLANYLLAAGYQAISTEVASLHYDNRAPKQRAAFIDEWTSLLLSGAPGLLKAGKVTQATVNEMTRELSRLKDDPDSVVFISFIRAQAQAF